MSDPQTHARFAPSAAHRWLECPGSIALSAGIPDTSSEFADEGTFAHDIAARALLGLQSIDKYVGTVSACGRFTVDAAMVDALRLYTDAFAALQMMDGVGPTAIEERVALSDDVYGTADALAWSGDRKTLHVMDLKYGQGVYVEVERNPQLMIYGAAALRSRRGTSIDVERVTLHVVQPRHPARPAWRSWTIARDELDAFGQGVVDVAASIKAGADTLYAGDWCRWCPAKATCPKLRETALEAARAAFADVDALTPATSPPDPAALSDDDLGRALTAAGVVETWLSAVRAYALERVRAGYRVPGWKLVRGQSRRSWIDETTAAAWLAEHGVEPRGPAPMISPAQAEKQLPREIRADVARLCAKSDAGTVLASESDRRPGVSPADVFLQ